jgi:tetratricopeptide (TPR) repeat protein
MSRTGRGAWRVGAVGLVGLTAAAGVWAFRRGDPREAEQVRRAVAEGRFAAAEAPLKRWLDAPYRSGEANYYACRIALARGDTGAAQVQHSLAQANGCPRERLVLLNALITAKAGLGAEAEPELRRAFERSAGPDPQLDEALAKVYLETYDLNRAAVVLDRWARDAPGDPKPYLWRAEVDTRNTADPAPAMNDYREALRRDPSLAAARLGLAEALRKAHRNDEAASEYEAYLAQKPGDAAAHLGAGQNLMEKGDPDAATRHLERALALDPRSAPALKELAEHALRRGEFARALGYLDRAVALDPDDAAARRRRALALTRLGRAAEAETEQAAAKRVQADLDRLNEVRRQLFRSPRDRTLQLEVARWMFDHGHETDGVRWAERVLREEPGDPEASRLLAAHYTRRKNAGLANFYRLNAAPAPPRR